MDFKKTVWLVAAAGMLAGSVVAAEPKISLSAENQPLGEVLKRIENSSGVQVELSDQKWAKDPVSFSVKNSDIEKVLSSALSPYDYVLEWYAAGNDFSKVVVTVHERKPVINDVLISRRPDDGGDSGQLVKNKTIKTDEILTGRALTLYMAAEVERRRKSGVVTPGITEQQREEAPKMADMVQRMGKVK